MASAAVLWFGETMSAVPLRNSKAAASAVRVVTVLGATGSIGDSTMDLLRATPERYQVEALTANSNVTLTLIPAAMHSVMAANPAFSERLEADEHVGQLKRKETAFERKAFDTAEQAYTQVLLLTPPQAAGRNELIERQAASLDVRGGRRQALGHHHGIGQVG